MSTKPKRKPPADPSEAANKRILAGIAAREAQREAEKTLASDIGLDVKPAQPPPANAFEMLSDEFDRRNFGDRPNTYTRVVYGPDPLLQSCPTLKASLEKYGLEDYAKATAELIRTKGAQAVPDAVMQRGLAASIARFGVDAVANAFIERIMKIPCRTVEVEADTEDPLLLGRPLEEAVERYGSPGMAVKFLSDSCISHFGLRGYVIVKNEAGDPVRVGTLVMGEIPEYMAERRRRHYAEQSNRLVRDMEQAFDDVATRDIGGRSGFGVLREGETVNAQAAGDFADDPMLAASYLGRQRTTGIRLDREV